jgi:mercuric ion transport protein
MKKIAITISAALMSSLCCITPVLALVAGTSGIASTFSWLDPFRPYLASLTILLLGFAWFQKLKPVKIGSKNELECACEPEEAAGLKARRQRFLQSTSFLAILTVFAGLMLAFPYYSHIFYPKAEKQIILVDKSNIRSIEFIITGMTCSGCAEHVNHEVNKLPGIVKSDASYENGNAHVEFDKSKIGPAEIEAAINSTGYRITDKIEN